MLFMREQWCRDVLNILGNSTPDDIILQFMIGWTVSETKAGSGATFNLLNSTHDAPGATNYNTTGVKNYISYSQGIEMTVKTLNDGYYPYLLAALKNNDVSAFNPPNAAILANLNTWCGGCGYGMKFIELGTMHRNDAFSYGGSTMHFDASGWLDAATGYDYTNKSMSRQGYKITHLVLHGTAGGTSADGIATYFRDSTAEASAHIIIDQAGNIAQGIPLSLAAWANGVVTAGHAAWLPANVNPNFYTASIEFVKASTDNSNELTPIQFKVGCEVIKCICDTYGIPKRAADGSGGVMKHADVDPINRARCPGPFDWNGLWNYLAGNQPEEPIMIGLDNPVVAQFFSGDDNAWKCKQNGFVISGAGAVMFYQTLGGKALCGLTYLGLPVSGPVGVTGKPGVVYQRFERAVLCYDPQHIFDNPPGAGAFYLAHIDQGVTQDPRITPLQLQNAQLKDQVAVLQKQIDAGQTIPQSLIDDIKVLVGNVTKLKTDAGIV